MAQSPQANLVFAKSCSDCGQRQVELPRPLPEIGDDFDWMLRDYDSFRLFMLEELAALHWVGMDCVEVAPAYDHAELTTNAAATFVWTYLSGQVAKHQER